MKTQANFQTETHYFGCDDLKLPDGTNVGKCHINCAQSDDGSIGFKLKIDPSDGVTWSEAFRRKVIAELMFNLQCYVEGWDVEEQFECHMDFPIKVTKAKFDYLNSLSAEKLAEEEREAIGDVEEEEDVEL